MIGNTVTLNESVDISQVYPAYTAAGARIHVASDVANNVRSHSAPRLPPKEAMTPSPCASAAGTPAKKKLSTGGAGHRVSLRKTLISH